MLRAPALLLSSVLLSALAACSSAGGSDAAASSATNDALKLAARACNQAMAEVSDLAEELNERQQAADAAAEAAVKDETWDDLAAAANEWAFTLKTFNESNGGEDLSLTSLQEMSDDLTENKADLSAQCRKVNSAGGSVDQDVLNKF